MKVDSENFEALAREAVKEALKNSSADENLY